MADDNKKLIARVPIVPDGLENQNQHLNHELVIDYDTSDLYVKSGDAYSNITGKLKEEIKEIQDGSSIIHIVTDQTLPPVKDRSENNWYMVIESAEDNGGNEVSINNYIYYGLIKTYDSSKNYVLIAQNMTSSSGDVIKMSIIEGYCPCFYVPISYGATFYNQDTGDKISASIEDRVYAMNSDTGTFVSYDVYSLELYDEGDYNIRIDLSGSDTFEISFEGAQKPSGLVLPSAITISDGDCIGTIPDPTWGEARYEFVGWSTDKDADTIIDPVSYKPSSDMTLYAWFTYNDEEDMLEAYATCVSSTSED